MRFFTRLKITVLVTVVVLILSTNFAMAVEIGTDPPSDPPYSGGYFITGSSLLGTVTVYTPVSDGWCLDSSGYLFRYGSNTATGKIYTSSGSVYDFRASAFSAAQYRSVDSSYTYSDLRLVPADSNISIKQDFEPLLDHDYMLGLFTVAMLGMIFISIITKRG